MTADAVVKTGVRPLVALLTSVLTVVLAGACATTAPAPAAPAAPSVSAAAPAPPAAGSVRLTGTLLRPATLGVAELAGMPQTEATVTYQSGQGPQTRRERGVPLATLIPPAALAVDPARKNDLLTFGVLAIGADGYQALVSYGETSADFGNRGLLVSLAEDGKPLARPRLVVPGDLKGGRYVSDLVELRVVRAAA